MDILSIFGNIISILNLPFYKIEIETEGKKRYFFIYILYKAFVSMIRAKKRRKKTSSYSNA